MLGAMRGGTCNTRKQCVRGLCTTSCRHIGARGEAWRVRLWLRECPFGLCGSGSASRRRSPIAQLAERVAVNRKVASSNLAGRVPFAPRHRKTLANRLSLRCRVHVDRRDYFY